MSLPQIESPAGYYVSMFTIWRPVSHPFARPPQKARCSPLIAMHYLATQSDRNDGNTDGRVRCKTFIVNRSATRSFYASRSEIDLPGRIGARLSFPSSEQVLSSTQRPSAFNSQQELYGDRSKFVDLPLISTGCVSNPTS